MLRGQITVKRTPQRIGPVRKQSLFQSYLGNLRTAPRLLVGLQGKIFALRFAPQMLGSLLLAFILFVLCHGGGEGCVTFCNYSVWICGTVRF